jgi:hypothetical protein
MTIEADPLFILIPQEDSPAHELESFIANILYRAGYWDSPRTSDGISFWRVVERSPTLVRICGRIYEISQNVYSFWLDLERDKERPEQINWTLYFDIELPGSWSPRRAAMVIEVIDVPEQAEWRVALMGTALAQAETLVAESVYALPMENSPL